MESSSPNDVTGLLRAWTAGDNGAGEQLWPVIYLELKRLAHRKISQEQQPHTLQSGALVNELYLRVSACAGMQWENRTHFFRTCARMMRQILIDHARARHRQKRQGERRRISLDEIEIGSEATELQLLDLNAALDKLATVDRRKAEVVEMRFFGGMTADDIAAELRVSRLTVLRDWNFARAWLISELDKGCL